MKQSKRLIYVSFLLLAFLLAGAKRASLSRTASAFTKEDHTKTLSKKYCAGNPCDESATLKRRYKPKGTEVEAPHISCAKACRFYVYGNFNYTQQTSVFVSDVSYICLKRGPPARQ
jgi:hypothetical protein